MSEISTPIYRKDASGAVRFWRYEVDGASWRAISGLDGTEKPVATGWTKCEPKNLGRSNATTGERQAAFESRAEEAKKLAREYRRTRAELAAVPTGPMLAKDYTGLKRPLDFKRRVFSQPKLDGIRCKATRHGAFSREYQAFTSCAHILSALAPIFERHPDLELDGELYNHDLRDNFNLIVSLVRREKLTLDQCAEVASTIRYYVYDLPSSLPFAERTATLKTLVEELDDPRVVFVPTLEVTTPDALDAAYGVYLGEGYEGQMIRLNAPYDFDKRSPALLKRKEFSTAEFELVAIEEGAGNWSGAAKRITFRLADGREVGAGIKGDYTNGQRLLELEALDERPKTVTVRYFTPTPDGIPRFPVAVDFHQNDRVD